MNTGKHKFVKVVGKGHSKCMVEHIRECWDKECYSNVKFICKSQPGAPVGKTLLANKAVLAASSQTLGFLLSETGEEDVTIIIPESDYNVVEMLLQYIYHGEVIAVDQLKNELEAFIIDWDITYPKVTEVSNDLQEQSMVLSVQNSQLSPARNLSAGFQPLDGTENSVIESHSSPTSDPTHAEQPPCIDLPIDPDGSTHTVTLPESFDEPIRHSRTTTSKKQSSGAMKSNTSKELENEDPLAITNSTSVTIKESSRKLPKPRNPTVNAKKTKVDGSERNPIDLTAMEEGDLSNDAMDTEEDKGDEILSKAFLNQEKARQKILNQSINDLKGSIKRHELYIKLFLGPSALPPPIQLINRNSTKKVPEVVLKIPCVTCGKMINRKYMKNHMFVHSSERPFLCEQCGATFARTDSLNHHVRFSHPVETEVHPCTLCDKTFTKRDYLKNHMSIHTGEKRHSCPYCDKSFRRFNGLLRHKRTHTGERPYECPTCHRKFSARSNYVTHLRTHQKRFRSEDVTGNTYSIDTESQLLKCPICSTKFHREQAYLIHVAAHTGEDPKLPCRYCTETFPSNKLLTKHAWDKHADSLFKCDQCPRMFMTQPCLNNHLSIHTGEKKFSCEDCDKQFRNKVLLKNHRRSMHSTERPFTCRFCPKSFKMRVTCLTHERIHTGERPYKCPHCVKSFRQDSHLVNHIRIHTGEKPFVCEFCNKAFTFKNSCSEHMRIHTGEKNQCATCGQVFRSVVKLRQHESTHNSNEEDEENEEEDSLRSSEEDEED